MVIPKFTLIFALNNQNPAYYCISQPAKQADRVPPEAGLNSENIQKVSSNSKLLKDGTQIETHAFRDVSTNELIEPKTIIGD